jgi:adenylate kinase family enzyme
MLSLALGIPAHSLDTIVWQPHWQKTLPAQRRIAEQDLTSQSTWIIEGVSEHIREVADLVIYLDLPRHQCLRRALQRSLRHVRTQRPEFPSDCPEWKIIPTLAGIIWRFPKLVGQKLNQEAARAPQKYWVIRSDKAIDTLLKTAGTTGCLLPSSRPVSVDSRRRISG